MDFKKLIEQAFNLTLENIVALILLTLLLIVISALSFGLLAPVASAGYTHAIIRLIREGREPRMQDIFAHMQLFLPLLGFGILVTLAIFIGYALLVLPGIILACLIAYVCLYMLPIMTDQQLPLVDAIKESYRMTTTGSLSDNIIVAVLFIGVVTIGGSTLIGTLLTQPIATVFIALVYEEKIRL
jgi:small-conductance mechanosensitive channel